MKQKHKKNEFESDFENSELDALNEEIDDLKKLSKAERKMLRAAKRKGVDRSTLDPYDQSDKAEFKRYAKKHKATVAIVSITIALLLAIIGTVVAILIIRQQGKPSSANYEVTVGEDKPYTLSYKEANS